MKIPPNAPPNGDSPDEDAPSRQERIQAEAIEDVRRRVRAQEGRAEAEAQMEAGRRRRERPSPWELGRRDNSAFWLVLLAPQLFLGLGFALIALLLSALVWLTESLRWPIYVAIRGLDFATGAQILRGAPWLMWTLWGAVFGGALGYWLVAPQYGDRENRAFVLLWPLLAMTLSSALLWAFVR